MLLYGNNRTDSLKKDIERGYMSDVVCILSGLFSSSYSVNNDAIWKLARFVGGGVLCYAYTRISEKMR